MTIMGPPRQGQDVEEEAADELVGDQGHDLPPVWAFGAVVLPPEGDAGSIEADEAGISDGDAVGVARQIGDLLRVVGRLPWTGGGGAWPRPAGVGQASGEETAGGSDAAVRPVRSMGI